MIKFSLALTVTLGLVGCSGTGHILPSFWDDNQSQRIIDARVAAERLNCEQPQLAQVTEIQRDLHWFVAYSDAKGYLQKDVISVVEPIKATVDEWVKRGEGGKIYCEMKKSILIKQTQRASEVILGRW